MAMPREDPKTPGLYHNTPPFGRKTKRPDQVMPEPSSRRNSSHWAVSGNMARSRTNRGFTSFDRR